MNDKEAQNQTTLVNFGERLRTRRKTKGLSLRELGEKIDLTASFLAQVERGEANPSIVSLQRIANALDVPIFYFFSQGEPERRVVSRDNRAKLSFPDSNVTYELLLPNLDHKSMGLVIRLGPGERIDPICLTEPTEEWLLLIQGEVTVHIAGNQHPMKPGDSIWYESWELQCVESTSDTEAVLVCNMTPPAF
jgi:transcriptional regulator with XRE-family HTH domain